MSNDLGSGLIKGGQQATKRLNAAPKDNNAPMPGLEFLGCGFDGFGECHASSKRANIFDFLSEAQEWRDQVFIDRSLAGVEARAAQAFNSLPNDAKLSYRIPKLVDFSPDFSVVSSTTKTSSLQDVQTSLGIGLEADMEIGLFAGEFSARFDMKQMQMSTTEAYSVDARIVYAHLSMDNYNQTTPAPMRAGVQEDLDGVSIGGRKVLSPDEILDNYGTHYVKGFDLGTMIVLSFSNDTSRNTTELDLSAALSARYGEAGEGGGGKLDTEMSKKVASQMASIKQDVRAWGVGDEELQGLGLLSGSSESSISSLAPAADNGADAGGHDDAADATASPFDILKEGWHNPTLIAVDPRNLVEISTLCKNRKRAAAIKAAYLARQAQVAAGLPAALGLLTPLYRFRIIDSGQSFYRFNQAITPPSEGSWAENCNGQPAFCVRTSPADGLMPLYACRYKGMNWWRYETSTWDDWLKAVGQGNWWKVSGTPVGYVFDGMGRVSAPKGTVPVYAYFPKNPGPYPRFYYSTDTSDSADSFGWELSLRFDRPWEGDPHGGYSPTFVGQFKDFIDFPASSPHWFAFPTP